MDKDIFKIIFLVICIIVIIYSAFKLISIIFFSDTTCEQSNMNEIEMQGTSVFGMVNIDFKEKAYNQEKEEKSNITGTFYNFKINDYEIKSAMPILDVAYDIIYKNENVGDIKKDLLGSWYIKLNNQNFVYRKEALGYSIMKIEKKDEKNYEKKVGKTFIITSGLHKTCYDNTVENLNIIVKCMGPILYHVNKKK